MLPGEYNSVDQKILEKVRGKWKDTPIKFEVTNCSAYFHQDRFGQKEWVICLKISSKDVFALRKDLELKNEDYHPHITILEYVVE